MGLVKAIISLFALFAIPSLVISLISFVCSFAWHMIKDKFPKFVKKMSSIFHSSYYREMSLCYLGNLDKNK